MQDLVLNLMNDLKFNLLIAMLFSPIFLPIFVNPYSFRYIAAVFAMAALVFLSSGFRISSQFVRSTAHFYLLNLLLLVSLLVQLVYLQYYQEPIFKALIPFFLSIAVLHYFATEEPHKAAKQLSTVFFIVTLTFIAQFVLSAIEAYYGFTFVHDYLSFMTSGAYQKRSVFPLLGLPDPFAVLHFGFTGLLGPHNAWGSQLPFYNLIFYLMYCHTRRRYYALMMFVVLLAVLFNTTRISIIVILLTDAIIYLRSVGRTKLNLFVTVTASLFLASLFTRVIMDQLSYVSSSPDENLLIRFRLWDMGIYYISSHPASFFWGLGFVTMQDLVLNFTNIMGYGPILASFENAFFDILFLYGIIGLIAFVYFLFRVASYRPRSGGSRFLPLLLAFNILGVSVTLSGIIYEYILEFVTLIFVYIVISNSNLLHHTPHFSYRS